MRFFIDNQPVRCSLRRGRCRVDDINRLLMLTLDHITKLGMIADYKWVPSAMNIADGPSRGTLVENVRQLGCSRTVRAVISELSSIISHGVQNSASLRTVSADYASEVLNVDCESGP